MTRRELLDSMLARYGTPVQIQRENVEQTESCRAFIQSLRYQAEPVSNEIGMPAGNLDKGFYLYMGSVSQRLDRQFGTIVIAPEKKFLVIKAECILFGGEPLYVRATLQTLAE